MKRRRKDKHGPTEACPQCRYVVPRSRPYLMKNHLERLHRNYENRSKPVIPPRPVPYPVKSPSPVRRLSTPFTLLRSPSLDLSLEPVEINTRDYDLLGYIVDSSEIFSPPRKVLRKDEGSAPEPVPVSASPYCRCQSPCYPCLVHLNQSLCVSHPFQLPVPPFQ